MADEAPEITAARIQAAGAIAAAMIAASGDGWRKVLLGGDNIRHGTAAGEVYARVLRGMIDAEPTM